MRTTKTRCSGWLEAMAVTLVGCSLTDSGGGSEGGAARAAESSDDRSDMHESSDDAGPPAPGHSEPAEIPGWRLVYRGDFDGGSVDHRAWSSAYRGPAGAAPDFTLFRPENLTVDSSGLSLSLAQRTVDGRPYTGAGIEMTEAYYFQTDTRWTVHSIRRGRGNVGTSGYSVAT